MPTTTTTTTTKSPLPTPKYAHVTIPPTHPHVLLVTLNRPRDLNCINSQGHQELHSVFEWFDEEPRLRVAVITGEGRAFCAGADLKEWNTTQSQPDHDQNQSHPARRGAPLLPPTGFGGLSRRTGKKPIIAAVNGLCLGGGCEMIMNVDIVITCEKAFFGFPEVQRGVVAWAGALPRVVRTVGRQRAMEMVLTGRRVSAREAEKWGFVNEVVQEEKEVVGRALEVAALIAANSPDAVIVSREGVKMGWEGVGAEEGTRLLLEMWEKKLNAGENIKEGLRAFVEKRQPNWVESKL